MITRPTRTSYRHGNVRAEAVAAGLDMVMAQGHAALSLRQVAEAVGVAHRSLYNHFEDREALLAAIAEAGFLQLAAGLQKAATRDDYSDASFGEDDMTGDSLGSMADGSLAKILALQIAVQRQCRSDRSDGLIDHGDAERIATGWPGAEIIKAEGYGHNRILQAAEVWERIQAFLTQER